MIRAIGTDADGKRVVMLGLSFGNLDKFRAEPGDTFIRIKGSEIGVDHDIIIFSCRTEDEGAEAFKRSINEAQVQALADVRERLRNLEAIFAANPGK